MKKAGIVSLSSWMNRQNVLVTDAKEVGVGNPAEETFCRQDAPINAKIGAAVKPLEHFFSGRNWRFRVGQTLAVTTQRNHRWTRIKQARNARKLAVDAGPADR